jgi:peptide deformylase
MVRMLVPEIDGILREVMPEYDFDTEDEEATAELAKDMVEALFHHGGVGLAAPQIGLRKRVFVMLTNPLRICFNPRIVDQSEEKVELDEGCLSIPDLILEISRPIHIKVRFALPNQEVLTETFTGMTARIFQHELDHLNGVLFKDHVSKMKLDMARRKTSKIIRV